MPEMGCLLLPQGSIGSAGYAALAAAIGDGMVPELRMLDVRENSLGNPGCAALAVVLRTHKNLEALDIRSNGIGNEGLAALVSESVDGEWPKLGILDVGKNQITNFGGTLISAFDSGAFPALEHLGLRDNLVEPARIDEGGKTSSQAPRRKDPPSGAEKPYGLPSLLWIPLTRNSSSSTTAIPANATVASGKCVQPRCTSHLDIANR